MNLQVRGGDHPEYCEIIFQNYNRTELYRSSVKYGGDAVYDGPVPTRESTAECRYVFSGWDKSLSNIKVYTTFIAKYTQQPSVYTVTWVNYDNTVLETDNNVPYGTEPSYDGETPIRESTETTKYTFKSWSPEIKTVTSDITYKAKFESSARTYTITWDLGFDNEVFTETYTYNQTPKWKNSDPHKPGDSSCYLYSFVGWNPEIKAVTSDATYTAQYEEETDTYKYFEYGQSRTKQSIIGFAYNDMKNCVEEISFPSPISMSEYNFEAIGERAFQNSKFKTISFETGYQYILPYAFYECTNLTSIDFGDSDFVLLSDFCFFGCTSLKTINVAHNKEEWDNFCPDVDRVFGAGHQPITLHCFDGNFTI